MLHILYLGYKAFYSELAYVFISLQGSGLCSDPNLIPLDNELHVSVLFRLIDNFDVLNYSSPAGRSYLKSSEEQNSTINYFDNVLGNCYTTFAMHIL